MSSDLLASPVIDTVSHAGDNDRENHTPDDLITFLCGSLALLWKDWPKQMNLTALEIEAGKFSLNGECPHCHMPSVFIRVTDVHAIELIDQHQRLIVGMQCQGCLDYILAQALKIRTPNRPSKLEYIKHYPLGKPDDSVDEHIKEPMNSNYREAIRCQWVDAHKAAVAMCRRAVEASCNDLGAKGRNLKRKIDDLAERRVIAESLQKMAHAVRITANEQLHGKQQIAQSGEDVTNASVIEIVTSDLDTFSKDDAEAIIEFTEQFFQYVYVMPERLKKYLKPEGETPANPS